MQSSNSTVTQQKEMSVTTDIIKNCDHGKAACTTSNTLALGKGKTMLKKNESKNQHWGKVDQLIEGWLKERQDLIILYVAVDGLKEIAPSDTPISVKLQAFSQMLIDYVSAGHFEIYDELTQEAEEFQDDYSELVTSVLPRIQESTELSLDFNDKYANLELCVESLDQVATDLSLLGEKMVERFELEDKMIEVLHTRHRELVA